MVRSTGITLDTARTEPLYRQLFDEVVSRVQSGAFPPGFRLPPSRSLARELGTHRNTVVRAFEELQSAGFVTSTVGRGTFVAPEAPEPEYPDRDLRSGLPWSSLVSRAVTSEPLGRLDRLPRPALGLDAVNLSKMQPSADLLPYDLLQRCIEHVLQTNFKNYIIRNRYINNFIILGFFLYN